jgi:alanyl-tRNA synthetase
MQIEILSCKQGKNGFLVTVRENPFYIDGKGGQLGDRGLVTSVPVLSSTEEGLWLAEELKPGCYEVLIDEERRRSIAENHTAQHLFSGLAWKLYGLNTLGFRMGEDYTTVDLDVRDMPAEQSAALERETNEKIREAVPVTTRIYTHDEAMEITGLRRAIKEKVKGDVRIVTIEGLDLSACAGYHVENTKDIRLFKLLWTEKIKGDATRLTYIAGTATIADYGKKHDIVRALGHAFSCRDYEILPMLEKTLAEKKAKETETRMLADAHAELLAERLKREADEAAKAGGIPLVFYGENALVAGYLGKYADPARYVIVTGCEPSWSVVSELIDCKALIAALSAAEPRIKGGGNAKRGNFKAEIGAARLGALLKGTLQHVREEAWKRTNG